jgi:hypothetical protein
MTANEPSEPNGLPDSPGVAERKRISSLAASKEALAYIAMASREKSVVIRETDKRTAQILCASVVGSLLFLALPLFGLAKFKLWCIGAADLSFILAVLLFIISRLGILRAMSMRHALLCWQLVVGASLLSMAITANLVLIILSIFWIESL